VYLLLVGVPLLGVIAVLHLGRAITPTMSVGGRWRIDAQGQLAPALACATDSPGNEPVPMDISQSGRELSFVLGERPGLALRGKIARSAVVASSRGGSTPSAHLRAEIDRRVKPATMVGTVDLGDCPDGGTAGAIPFRATREASSRTKADP
jgi:hypothetical protein